jgi:SlyX protein
VYRSKDRREAVFFFVGPGGVMEHEAPDEARARMEALEVKVAYQDATIEELSGALYEQDLRLDRLERLVKDFAGRLKEVAGEGLPPLPLDERPPHY